MLRNYPLLVSLMSAYLLLYCFLLAFEPAFSYAFAMLMGAPFLLGVMIYSIFKYGKPTKHELGNEEFGYADKETDWLNVF